MEKHIREALVVRLETDPAWAHLQVVFSGSDEAGEGEHKILQAMRRRRALPGYDPNRRRFIFGQDADLILLGLTTHEPRLCILREQWGAAEAVVAAVKVQETTYHHRYIMPCKHL
jgi:5'-3' exoribonuclease 1